MIARSLVLFALLIAFTALAFTQNETVTVTMKDGSSVSGTIVSRSDSTIVLATKYGQMTIPRADLASQHVIQAGKDATRNAASSATTQTITLKDGTVINGVVEHETADTLLVHTSYGMINVRKVDVRQLVNRAPVRPAPIVHNAENTNGGAQTTANDDSSTARNPYLFFPVWLARGGPLYSTVTGSYYDGFNSGYGVRLAIDYFFPDEDSLDSHKFIGVSYHTSSIGGDKMFGTEPTLSIAEYGIDVGITTPMFKGGHYLYALTGLVVVTNDLSVDASGGTSSSLTLHYNENKVAFRFEAGGSIRVSDPLSLTASVNLDAVLGQGEQPPTNSYGSTQTTITAVGAICNLSLGLSYILK